MLIFVGVFFEGFKEGFWLDYHYNFRLEELP